MGCNLWRDGGIGGWLAAKQQLTNRLLITACPALQIFCSFLSYRPSWFMLHFLYLVSSLFQIWRGQSIKPISVNSDLRAKKYLLTLTLSMHMCLMAAVPSGFQRQMLLLCRFISCHHFSDGLDCLKWTLCFLAANQHTLEAVACQNLFGICCIIHEFVF